MIAAYFDRSEVLILLAERGANIQAQINVREQTYVQDFYVFFTWYNI